MATRTPEIQHDVTLTRPNGESATFGPMPAFDAAIVAVRAADKGVRATSTPAK